MIDLDALETDAREGDRQGDARYPYVMEYEEALMLIAELRAARKVVEASKRRRAAWRTEASLLARGGAANRASITDAEEAEDAALAELEALE